jgi:hypothetical protein
MGRFGVTGKKRGEGANAEDDTPDLLAVIKLAQFMIIQSECRSASRESPGISEVD